MSSLSIATLSLATAFLPLAGARPEVRDPSGWRVDIADIATDGRYLLHWSAPDRSEPVAVIRGNMAESGASADAFAGFLTMEANPWDTPNQAAKQCLASEIMLCCGTQTVCENFCWVAIDVQCSNPDGTGGCVVSCFSPGCKDENCGWLWCECPEMPTSVD